MANEQTRVSPYLLGVQPLLGLIKYIPLNTQWRILINYGNDVMILENM